MRIATLSGKGGVGKSTISVALSYKRGLPIVGADVESPTTMLLYGDEAKRREEVLRRVAKIGESCIGCGICVEACPYAAILAISERPIVDEEACEGCMYCASKCPVNAIEEEKIKVGEILYGERVLKEGVLLPGKKESRIVLESVLRDLPREVIIDASPGASPLAYRTARKADAVIVVVEPNKLSVADASRVLEILSRLEKPSGIVINKHGIGREELIVELSRRYEVPIIGKVGYYRELLKKKPLECEKLLEDVESIELEFSVPRSDEEERLSLPELPRGERLSEHIAVVSGKGGTGKTLVAIGLSKYLNIPLVDADIDAPDSYVLLGEPRRKRSEKVKIYEIDPDLCTACGKCREACYVGAIDESFKIIPELCEGCGICVDACPYDAIKERLEDLAYIGEGENFLLAISKPGRAGIGEFVYRFKYAASKLDRFIIDGPPGSGCTTISSIVGSKAVIIVTEPKEESLMSARRVAEIAKHFKIKTYVIVNKRQGEAVEVSDIGELLGYVPYDEEVFEAYALGKRPEGSKAAEAIRKISRKLSLEDLH